jgi:hypothetical protein
MEEYREWSVMDGRMYGWQVKLLHHLAVCASRFWLEHGVVVYILIVIVALAQGPTHPVAALLAEIANDEANAIRVPCVEEAKDDVVFPRKFYESANRLLRRGLHVGEELPGSLLVLDRVVWRLLDARHCYHAALPWGYLLELEAVSHGRAMPEGALRAGK